MRDNAVAQLKSDNDARVAAAKEILAALDDFETSKEVERLELIKKVTARPLAQRIIYAFKNDKPTHAEDRLIQVLLDNPDCTCAELSSKIGQEPNTWDLGFGRLCARRSVFLRPLAGTANEGLSDNIALLAQTHRDHPDGAIRYRMKGEAIEAFKQLGFRA